MRFDSLVLAFCDRFLAQRTFDLIVAPALADLEFETELGRRSRFACRCSVLRAVVGGLRGDLSRNCISLIKLTLLPACYYALPLVMGLEYFKTWAEFFAAVAVVVALSLVPVLVCFWPERHVVRQVE
jgi:hypothetical protein